MIAQPQNNGRALKKSRSETVADKLQEAKEEPQQASQGAEAMIRTGADEGGQKVMIAQPQNKADRRVAEEAESLQEPKVIIATADEPTGRSQD